MLSRRADEYLKDYAATLEKRLKEKTDIDEARIFYLKQAAYICHKNSDVVLCPYCDSADEDDEFWANQGTDTRLRRQCSNCGKFYFVSINRTFTIDKDIRNK